MGIAINNNNLTPSGGGESLSNIRMITNTGHWSNVEDQMELDGEFEYRDVENQCYWLSLPHLLGITSDILDSITPISISFQISLNMMEEIDEADGQSYEVYRVPNVFTPLDVDFSNYKNQDYLIKIPFCKEIEDTQQRKAWRKKMNTAGYKGTMSRSHFIYTITLFY